LEEPDRNEADGKQSPPEDSVEGPANGTAQDTAEVEVRREETSDPEELKARLRIKDTHIRELFEQITASRLAADEARAAHEAGEEHIASLERERARLKERIQDLEEEARRRRRRREGLERRVARLQREIEHKDGEIARRDYLLERHAEGMEDLRLDTEELAARKDQALEDALRRIAGLERDLEERENEVAELRATIEDLRNELDAEYELREHLAEPANRLRAGIDLFNDSEQRHSMNSLSRQLGQPEVHVDLEEGEEPSVLLTFTWQGVTRQTYAANPGLAVEEPRVYLKSTGEDLSGLERQPPNARVGPGGRVLLGL
jgi:chromosome segregation ATPase